MPGRRARLADVAAVIVTYNSSQTLGACLDRLPRDELASVVVVDNASRDGSAELAASFPAVEVVRGSTNLGFGAACNTGTRATSAPYVLFLNPDAVLDAVELERLVAYLDQHATCAVAAPRVFRDGRPLPSAGRGASLWTELRVLAPATLARRIPERRLPAEHDVSGPCAYVEGACMLVRRAAFEAAGGFDERYFLFYEELDLGRRLAAAGLTMDLVADARVEHLVGASRQHAPHAARGAMVRSATTYLHVHEGRARAVAYRALVLLLLVLRTAREPGRYRESAHLARQLLRR